MDSQKQIQILMATYNGAAFLQQQLTSIAAQTHTNWQLLVRDDGSTDATSEILDRFQNDNSDRVTIEQDGLGNLGGAAQNFAALLDRANSHADAFSFADQDDRWNPDKLKRSLQILGKLESEHGSKTAALAFHDFSTIDENDHTVRINFNGVTGDRTQQSRQKLMPFCSGVHGFTMLFNRSLLEAARPLPQPTLGHDTTLACLASDIGIIEFIPEKLAEYRRHGNNVSEHTPYYARAMKTLPSRNGLNSAWKAAHDNLQEKCKVTEAYLERYGDIITPDRRELLDRFAHMSELPMLQRKKLILDHIATSPITRIIAALVL